MDFKFDKSNIKWIKGDHNLPECVLKVKVPSVTAIINELIPDPEYQKFIDAVGKERAEQIMISAGERGSSMHMFIENFLSKYSSSKDISESLSYTQENSPPLLEKEGIPINKIEEGRNLFYKFYYSTYVNQYSDVLAIELGVFSPSLFYRGKLDILYKNKVFGTSITDFKSSNGKIKKGSVKETKFKYQLGGYANAIEEMYAVKKVVINHASILCVDKQNDVLQEIELKGNELSEYKENFKTLVTHFHKIKNTEYLIQ